MSKADFKRFHEQTGAFMRGALPAADLHALCASLGLATEVPRMMALCPSEALRAEMLRVHEAYVRARGSGGSEASQQWVPPEALEAATSAAAAAASWACVLCTLINAPAAENCSACGTSRMVSAALRADEGGGGKKSKKKGTKMSLQEMHQVHPQNSWTQRR